MPITATTAKTCLRVLVYKAHIRVPDQHEAPSLSSQRFHVGLSVAPSTVCFVIGHLGDIPDELDIRVFYASSSNIAACVPTFGYLESPCYLPRGYATALDGPSTFGALVAPWLTLAILGQVALNALGHLSLLANVRGYETALAPSVAERGPA